MGFHTESKIFCWLHKFKWYISISFFSHFSKSVIYFHFFFTLTVDCLLMHASIAHKNIYIILYIYCQTSMLLLSTQLLRIIKEIKLKSHCCNLPPDKRFQNDSHSYTQKKNNHYCAHSLSQGCTHLKEVLFY